MLISIKNLNLSVEELEELKKDLKLKRKRAVYFLN